MKKNAKKDICSLLIELDGVEPDCCELLNDADIEKKTADIYLNYRLVGDDIPFENNVSSIDTYVIETGLKEKATF